MMPKIISTLLSKKRAISLESRWNPNDIKKEIALDFSREVEHHDVTDHYAAFTNVPGHELILLDVDHKRFLIFNLDGKLVGTLS